MATPMQVDKIDMSLDDIIKLGKKNKSGQNVRGRGRGRGRGGGGGVGYGQAKVYVRGGRGSSLRGRGGGRGRGGTSVGYSARGGQNTSLSQRGTRGQNRGQVRGRGRGRGRGQTRQNQAVDVSNQSTLTQSPRGRRGGGNQGVGLKSLNKRRQDALDTLMKAKQTLSQLNAKKRQQTRQTTFNRGRNLQGIQTSSRGRGLNRKFGSTMSLNSTTSSVGSVRGKGRPRGRGRGVLGSSFGSTLSLSSNASTVSRGKGRMRGRGRGSLGSSFGSTLSLASNRSISNVGSQQAKRRGWRKPAPQQDDSIFSISIQNDAMPPPSSPPIKQNRRNRKNSLQRLPTNDVDPSLAAQIASLKPAVSHKYNFKKAVFAQGSTSVRLTERFSAPASNTPQTESTLGRKVFF